MDISCDYVGQHVVRTYYIATTRPSGKEKLVAALVGPDVPNEKKEQLKRSKAGQNILNVTQADLYVRNKTEWKASVRKHEKGQSMLRDLEEMNKGNATITTSNPHVFNRPTNDAPGRIFDDVKRASKDSALGECLNPVGVDSEERGERRKRKRKRGGKKSNTEELENEDDLEKPGLNEEAHVEDSSKSTTALIPSNDKAKYYDATAESTPVEGSTTNHSEGNLKNKKKKKTFEEEQRSGDDSRHSKKIKRDHSDKKSQKKISSNGADMNLVRSLNSGKLMSRSLLSDTISKLEAEVKGHSK